MLRRHGRQKKVFTMQGVGIPVSTMSSMIFYVGTVALLLAKTENWMMVVNFLITEEHFLRAMIFNNQLTKI